jgi:hypothetical protein
MSNKVKSSLEEGAARKKYKQGKKDGKWENPGFKTCRKEKKKKANGSLRSKYSINDRRSGKTFSAGEGVWFQTSGRKATLFRTELGCTFI